jgi:hypothetical protein
MRNRAFVSCAVLCALVLLAGTSAFAGDAWLGKWKLNEAKSKVAPGSIRAQVLTFEAAGDAIKLSAEGLDDAGKPMKTGYTSKFDGAEVPWPGNPVADSAAPKRVDDHSYTNTWKKGGKAVMNAKVVVSPDGKTLTITNTPAAGGEASIAVFDKQ